MAPSKIPEMILFSNMRKTMMMGSPAMVEAAIRVGHVKTFSF